MTGFTINISGLDTLKNVIDSEPALKVNVYIVWLHSKTKKTYEIR